MHHYWRKAILLIEDLQVDIVGEMILQSIDLQIRPGSRMNGLTPAWGEDGIIRVK